MAEEQFTITYEGPPARMSVRELAPALLSLADAVRETQQQVRPLAPEPSLDIEAFGEGSFIVHLALSDRHLLDQVRDLFSGSTVESTVNLSVLVTTVFGGFRVVRKLAGRKIRRQEQLEDGKVRVTFDDSTSIVIPADSLTLSTKPGFREAAKGVVQPVSRPGVESVELSRGPADAEPQDTVRIDKNDLPGFELPSAADEELVDSERTVALRLVTVAFQEGNKWRVSDGESIFFATISDAAFVDRVSNNQEAFTRGDILRARVRDRQWRTMDGDLRTEHEILEVVEHIRGPREVPLPFEDEPDD